MVIELDPDEEAAIAAADAENADPADDAASEEGGEMEFLQELERIDRRLQATEEEKAETAKEYNDQIKALKKKRGVILDELEAYRLGERGLPLE